MVAFEEIKSDNAYFVHNIEKPSHNRGDNGKYAGVAKHLFAYVSKEAFSKGLDCIEFKAKSTLIEYYEKAINAKNMFRQMMCLEKKQMQELIDIYYTENDDETE